MNASLIQFYARLYRCEDCNRIRNPQGVAHFVSGKGILGSWGYLPPTVPVSHFGDIARVKLWVVTTNPKGDWRDSLVGLGVDQFGVSSRASLKEADAESIFETQCNYFRRNRSSWHEYFWAFADLLDRLPLGRQALDFRSGDVCFVDAIKCPTQTAWGSFVRSREGKEVWDNCLRSKNRFLPRQLQIHRPRRVLYYGTGGLVRVAQKGKKINESGRFSNKLKLMTRHLYSEHRLERVSVELSRANLGLASSELQQVRSYISRELSAIPLEPEPAV